MRFLRLMEESFKAWQSSFSCWVLCSLASRLILQYLSKVLIFVIKLFFDSIKSLSPKSSLKKLVNLLLSCNNKNYTRVCNLRSEVCFSNFWTLSSIIDTFRVVLLAVEPENDRFSCGSLWEYLLVNEPFVVLSILYF